VYNSSLKAVLQYWDDIPAEKSVKMNVIGTACMTLSCNDFW
jgi:hypothetical protein